MKHDSVRALLYQISLLGFLITRELENCFNGPLFKVSEMCGSRLYFCVYVLQCSFQGAEWVGVLWADMYPNQRLELTHQRTTVTIVGRERMHESQGHIQID